MLKLSTQMFHRHLQLSFPKNVSFFPLSPSSTTPMPAYGSTVPVPPWLQHGDSVLSLTLHIHRLPGPDKLTSPVLGHLRRSKGSSQVRALCLPGPCLPSCPPSSTKPLSLMQKFFLFSHFNFILEQFICNVVLTLGAQQSDSVIYIYIHTHIYSFFLRFFSHIGYQGILSRAPCAIQ